MPTRTQCPHMAFSLATRIAGVSYEDIECDWVTHFPFIMALTVLFPHKPTWWIRAKTGELGQYDSVHSNAQPSVVCEGISSSPPLGGKASFCSLSSLRSTLHTLYLCEALTTKMWCLHHTVTPLQTPIPPSCSPRTINPCVGRACDLMLH